MNKEDNNTTQKNELTVEYSDSSVKIFNSNREAIAELDRKYNDIKILPKENLIRYGYVKGRGGEGCYGYLDMEGNVLTEPIFYHEDDTYCDGDSFRGKNVIALRMNYMEYGLVNRRFETLIPFEYDELKIINKKYVVGKRREYYFLFDLEGNYIPAEVPASFKDASVKFDDENGFGTVMMGDSKKRIDLDGNLI